MPKTKREQAFALSGRELMRFDGRKTIIRYDVS